jgi:hypothetical protein
MCGASVAPPAGPSAAALADTPVLGTPMGTPVLGTPVLGTPVLGTPHPPAPPIAPVEMATAHRCRTCQAAVPAGLAACPTCGHPPLAGTSFCFRWRADRPLTDPCPNCRALINQGPAAPPAIALPGYPGPTYLPVGARPHAGPVPYGVVRPWSR